MATLVLSTVGTALGGPIGGAIGALVGQSFDQQLLAPASRGPRLGDLSVQTSTYGTQIPRIYGTMRIAGSVIWATDLVESEQTTGAKGQPDVTYSYSISLAVALSSRPIRAINRIWADGKLLRGAEGDFKVSTTFRFYDGSEDQPIDPLIGSIEGIANCPAYRGLALAVFEDLELAAYGNRIPFLTFEVVADDQPPTVAAILSDASAGVIATGGQQAILGYAAYGQSIKAAVEPLVDAYGVELFDDGAALRAPATIDPIPIGEDQLGNEADEQKSPRVQREQMPARSLPAVVRMSYYDPARDFQTGEARASSGEQSGSEVRQELPAVLSAADAKSVVEQRLTRAWAQRDKVIVRLPPSQVGLEPGCKLGLGTTPSVWTVEKCVVDAFVVSAELRPAVATAPTMIADAGRIIADADIAEGSLILALIDAPDLSGATTSKPAVYLAASTGTSGWRRHSVQVSFGGQIQSVLTARGKSILGRAVSVLNSAECELLDLANIVEIELIDADQWLTSCNEDALGAGANLAVLGNELVQFGSVDALGAGRFILSRLLRGRAGTEWATAEHVTGEPFCLLRPDTLQLVHLPDFARGVVVSATSEAAATSLAYSAESMRPPAPVFLTAVRQSNGDLAISWVRRSRTAWAWLDEIDAPLGEASERYDLVLTGPAGRAEFLVADPAVTVPSATIASLGMGQSIIEVRQVGDFGRSRPAQLAVGLP